MKRKHVEQRRDRNYNKERSEELKKKKKTERSKDEKIDGTKK